MSPVNTKPDDDDDEGIYCTLYLFPPLAALCSPAAAPLSLPLLTCLLSWFSKTPTSATHPQFSGGGTGTNHRMVSFSNIYSHSAPSCSWQDVLRALVNAALINRWGVWLGPTAVTDGDLLLHCDNEEEEKERRSTEAKITRQREQSVTQKRTERRFAKRGVTAVLVDFTCKLHFVNLQLRWRTCSPVCVVLGELSFTLSCHVAQTCVQR